MKVIDYNNTTHSITLIPRYYDFNEVAIKLTNDSDKVETIITVLTYNTNAGVFNFTFDFTFLNDDRYTFKLYDPSENDNKVIFRGNIIATNQNAQEYNLIKDLYYYEQ